MTKSLNQAFLRAFSKDDRMGGALGKVSAEVHPSTGNTPDPEKRVDSAAAATGQIRVDAGSDVGQRMARPGSEMLDSPRAGEVPAPHFETLGDARLECDRPELDTRETWILGELPSQSPWLDSTPLLVIPPSEEELDRDHATSALCCPEASEELVLSNERELSEEELRALAPPFPTVDAREPSAQRGLPGDDLQSSVSPAGTVVDGEDSLEPEASEEEPPSSAPTAGTVVECDPSHEVEGMEGFAGAWEVDHLGWTTVCRELYEGESLPFIQAGQQLFTAAAEGLRVLAITSAYRGEGRTTLSLLLARSAAAAGVRVAVMDADLDNPQLAWNARLQPASDWRRVLEDRSPLEEAAIHAVEERLTLFPLETQSRGEPLRLSDPRVTKLVHDIASRFDLLIIDMGPIANDDRRLFAAGKVCPIDAAVVVRDLRSTTDEQTLAVVRRLTDLGVEAVGIAENFSRDVAETLD
jgi:Mrp family chromosome partitioning ATPase